MRCVSSRWEVESSSRDSPVLAVLPKLQKHTARHDVAGRMFFGVLLARQFELASRGVCGVFCEIAQQRNEKLDNCSLSELSFRVNTKIE